MTLFNTSINVARWQLVAGLLCAFAGSVFADETLVPEARTEQVTARLVAAVTSVQPGQSLQLGVRQRIVDHWHTYWANPGDSGLATTVAWELPGGAQAGPIEWPTPSRFQLGPITNYGYASEVTLLSTLSVPSTLREGDTFRVKAKVNWLVCHDTCIPQDVVLGLELPVRAGTPESGSDAALLSRARERLPAPFPGSAQWRRDGQALVLAIDAGAALPEHDGAYFFAARWGQVSHAAEQVLQRDAPAGWRLGLVAGESPPKPGEAPAGVLVLSRAGQPVQAYAFADAPPAVEISTPVQTSTVTLPSLVLALGLALLGGLVLNLMPCVFPVLSIKALSLLQASRESPRTLRLHGLAYTAGVLLSFVLLAGVLIVLKAGGDRVGWGFQFQSPVFVLLLGLLMFAVGLSLSGVFTLGVSVAGVGSSLVEREGLAGSFFTGVLATVVATPCTAPFMGAAIGYAVTQPALVTLAVFVSLGLGLALPYLLLCEWPALQRRMPRPGAWMERLRQGFAFPMYASAAWLAWVLAQQAGVQAVAVALGAAVALAFAGWFYNATRQLGARSGHVAAGGAALLAAFAVVGGALAIDEVAEAPQAVSDAPQGAWEAYSPQRLDALRSQGKPVFVNLTAAWCITCLLNERVALSSPHVQAAFAQAGVTRLKGDWTRRDERITRLLAEHGRSGVPLYLFYPAGAGSQATVLPQLLTPDLVLAALEPAPRPSSP